MLVLIDNYDSFTYNLVHYFEEIGEKVKVFRNDEITTEKVIKLNPEFIVISPGPSVPSNSGICMDLVKTNSKMAKTIPTLGVCLGHQVIAECFNSSVIQSGKPIHGKVSKIYWQKSKLFDGMQNPFNATRYHSLIVDNATLPECLKITAETKEGEIMGVAHEAMPIWGVQFHPESILSQCGHELLNNFLQA